MQECFFTYFVPCVLNSQEQLGYLECSTFLLPIEGQTPSEGWGVCMGPCGVGPSRLWPCSCPGFRPWSPVTPHCRPQSHLEERWMLMLFYFWRGGSTWLTIAGEQEKLSEMAQVSHSNGSGFFKFICLNWWVQLWKDQLSRPSSLGSFPHICNWDIKTDLKQSLINVQMRCSCSLLLTLGRQTKQYPSSWGKSTSI